MLSLGIVYLISAPCLYWLNGKGLLLFLDSKFRAGLSQSRLISNPLIWSLGLVFHLWITFALKCLGLPWLVAILLSFLPAGFQLWSSKGRLEIPKFRPTLNSTIWILFVFVTGISLVEYVDGALQTPWKNNYGDLAFHIGQISSFVFGDNFPPQYPIFAGEALSYPFFVNLWTASVWWLCPSWYFFSVILLWQWCLIWGLIYYAFDGDRLPIIPWAIILGGGSYFSLFENSGELIEKSFPWTSLITTIWVPQRSAFLGLLCVAVILKPFILCWNGDGDKDWSVLWALGVSSALLALLPVFHGHFFLVASSFVFVTAAFNLARTSFLFVRSKAANSYPEFELRLLGVLVLTHLLLLLSMWLLAGKEGMLKLGIWGSKGSFTDTLVFWANLWAFNWWQVVLVFVLLWIVSKWHVYMLSLLSLFCVFHFVILSAWHWDQIKLFVGLYAVLLLLWSCSKSKFVFAAHFALIVLAIPSALELWELVKNPGSFTIYDKDKIATAEQVRSLTESSDIIAAAPDHNSLVTLTGRRLFYGFEGTLASHSVSYLSRKELMSTLEALSTCKEHSEVCPDYLLWTDAERRYWKRSSVPPQLVKMNSEFLYKVQ